MTLFQIDWGKYVSPKEFGFKNFRPDNDYEKLEQKLSSLYGYYVIQDMQNGSYRIYRAKIVNW